MNKRIENNKYSGQALAIAMLVLVVSSLIGLAMYSRSQKDRALSLEERASAEALEVSDILLNNITRFSMEEMVGVLNEHFYTAEDEEFDEDEGIVLVENINTSEISEFFGALELEIQEISSLISPLCPVSITPNEYQLTIKRADPDIAYELRPGHVWTLPTRKLSVPADSENDCILQLNFSTIGDPWAGFLLTKMYCEYDEEIGLATSCPEDDVYNMEKFRFQDSLGNTYAGFLDSNWTNVDVSGYSKEISLRGGNVPTEIRVKALGQLGSTGIGISYELSEECPEIISMYHVRATANCSGVYRGKEILIPQRGHNLLFDYVYFRGL